MRTARVLLALAGTLAAGYGVVGLVDSTSSRGLRSALVWLIGGALLHDGVLVPVTLLTGVLACRLVPVAVRPAAQAGLIVSGAVVIVAAPFVSRRGYTTDNTSALPLNYTHGLIVVLGTVWACVLAVAVAHRVRAARRARRDTHPDLH